LNHKPGFVPLSRSEKGAAICLKMLFQTLFCSLPALNRRAAGEWLINQRFKEPILALFDFAPDEACHFPASLESFRHCCQYRGGLLPRHFTLSRPLKIPKNIKHKS